MESYRSAEPVSITRRRGFYVNRGTASISDAMKTDNLDLFIGALSSRESIEYTNLLEKALAIKVSELSPPNDIISWITDYLSLNEIYTVFVNADIPHATLLVDNGDLLRAFTIMQATGPNGLDVLANDILEDNRRPLIDDTITVIAYIADVDLLIQQSLGKFIDTVGYLLNHQQLHQLRQLPTRKVTTRGDYVDTINRAKDLARHEEDVRYISDLLLTFDRSI